MISNAFPTYLLSSHIRSERPQKGRDVCEEREQRSCSFTLYNARWENMRKKLDTNHQRLGERWNHQISVRFLANSKKKEVARLHLLLPVNFPQALPKAAWLLLLMPIMRVAANERSVICIAIVVLYLVIVWPAQSGVRKMKLHTPEDKKALGSWTRALHLFVHYSARMQ